VGTVFVLTIFHVLHMDMETIINLY